MRKRVFILLTLIISLFIFCDRVEAAKEMYCIYEGTWAEVSTMLVQDSSGEISVYFHKKTGVFASDDPDWYEYNQYKIVFESKYYNEQKKELNKCPDFKSIYQTKSEIVFHDEEMKGQENRKLIDYSSDDEDFDVGGSRNFSIPSLYQEQIENTKWLGKCVYGLSESAKIELYFNNDTYIIANYLSNSTTAYFSVSKLLDVVYDAKACPPYLYIYSVDVSGPPSYSKDEIYLFYEEIKDVVTGAIGGSVFSKNDMPIVDSDVDIDFGSTVVPDDSIDDCHDLFGEKLVEQINKIMDIVKIVVPLLIIALGIVDFTKAVFAGKEDDMKKAQKTFFNRIIAAILVFVAPIFINLILTLGNEVWGYISPETCIKNEK